MAEEVKEEPQAFLTLSVPVSLKEWLAKRSEKNARSMNREAGVILKRAMQDDFKEAA